MNNQVFAILSHLVETRTGLHYGELDEGLFMSKVQERIAEAGFSSPLDYYYYLRYDAGSEAEFGALVETLVVQETYFFRETAALEVLVDDLVRSAVTRKGRARVWSAACSSGEEPFTLAMMLHDAKLDHATDIVASDISPRALGIARHGGSYGERSLRNMPRHMAERWLRPDSPGRVRVREELLEHITFLRINLNDATEVAKLGTFDVILCRNVLIYFSDENIPRVVGHLAQNLEPSGRLLVGASESLMRFGTLLRSEERGGAFFYRRSPP